MWRTSPVKTTGGHRRFRSTSSPCRASMAPTVAKLHGANPIVTYWSVIRSGSNTARRDGAEAPGRAVDEDPVAVGGHVTLVGDDRGGTDVQDLRPRDPPDGAQGVDLAHADRCASEQVRLRAGVDPHEDLVVLGASWRTPARLRP